MKFSIIGLLTLCCSVFGHIDLEADHDIHQKISQLMSFEQKRHISGVTYTETLMTISGEHAPELIPATDKVLAFFQQLQSMKNKRSRDIAFFNKMLIERGLDENDMLILSSQLSLTRVDRQISKLVEQYTLEKVNEIRTGFSSDSSGQLEEIAAAFMFNREEYEANLRGAYAVELMTPFSPHGQLIILSFIDEFFVPGMTKTYLRSFDNDQIQKTKEFLFPNIKFDEKEDKNRNRKWHKSGINVAITEGWVWCGCDDPAGPGLDGTLRVGGTTRVKNPDYRFNIFIFTVAKLVVTTNVPLFNLEEMRGSDYLYTVAENWHSTIVPPGLYRAHGHHEGFESNKTNLIPLNGEKVTRSSSDACRILPYQEPTDEDCEPAGVGDRWLDKGIFDDSCVESPLVIDLDQDGFEFSPPGVGAYFDILGHGRPIFIQWLKPHGDDALLALDLNENGLIDSGRELFGEGTQLILRDRIPADHGYQALAQYDKVWLGGNQDGVISQEDEIWHRLLLWHDFDGDGYSDSGEVEYLSSYGQWRLPLVFKKSRMTDEAGNQLRYWSWIYDEHMPFKTRMVDVFFKRIQSP